MPEAAVVAMARRGAAPSSKVTRIENRKMRSVLLQPYKA